MTDTGYTYSIEAWEVAARTSLNRSRRRRERRRRRILATTILGAVLVLAGAGLVIGLVIA